jgi:hypothetical protein
MGGGDEYVDGLGRDVRREQEEGDADYPQRPPLPLGTVDVLELPDDDERSEDLYQRVEPESCERNPGERPASSTITEPATQASAPYSASPRRQRCAEERRAAAVGVADAGLFQREHASRGSPARGPAPK